MRDSGDTSAVALQRATRPLQLEWSIYTLMYYSSGPGDPGSCYDWRASRVHTDRATELHPACSGWHTLAAMGDALVLMSSLSDKMLLTENGLCNGHLSIDVSSHPCLLARSLQRRK